MTWTTLPLPDVRLTGGIFDARRQKNREYLVSLREENLLQNHLIEAGIGDHDWFLHPSKPSERDRGLHRHWGWETPGSLLRGHFLGHWMSAAAREVAVTGDALLRAKLETVLDGLERCQAEGDGEWVFPIPFTFLTRMAAGHSVWAPQYDLHKTLMGLVDVARELGIARARDIAHRASQPLLRWARTFDTDQFQQILETETGGMLEVWADLLEATGDTSYRELLDRYYHRSLFDGILAGDDMLTNMHANTTIPEIVGAARAYEVTGDERWRRIVEGYWDWAVTRRGTFCTGGQTSGEIWTPPFEFAARRGEKTQEHCSVYNMIRLADTLFRWSGAVHYLDYIEKNLYNGILAQQHPETGMVAYFLPLEGGAVKDWGSPTEDFWCCHGTLVQAHTRHASLAFYASEGADTLTVAQFIPATATVLAPGGAAEVALELVDNALDVGPDANAGPAGETRRPRAWRVRVTASGAGAPSMRLRVRIPEWVTSAPVVSASVAVEIVDGFAEFTPEGERTVVELALPFALQTVAIPDEPDTYAFVEGPVVLAGLTDAEQTLRGDPEHPASLLAPDNERQWTQWLTRYRSVGQERSVRFVPLHEVTSERFTVYFPIAREIRR